MKRWDKIREITRSNPDREMEERKAKHSARNKPLAGATLGAASGVRRLSPEEFQRRKAELERK